MLTFKKTILYFSFVIKKYDDIKKMTEMKDKIYPTLPTIRETPNAPPIVNGGEDDRGHSYRLNVIRDVQKFLEEEIKKT